MGRPERSVIVAFNERLRFMGIYLNAAHAASIINGVTPNTAQQAVAAYVRGDRQDCYGMVFVRHPIDSQPINTHDIRETVAPIAAQRHKQARLLQHLSEKALRRLDSEDIDHLYKKLFPED